MAVVGYTVEMPLIIPYFDDQQYINLIKAALAQIPVGNSEEIQKALENIPLPQLVKSTNKPRCQ